MPGTFSPLRPLRMKNPFEDQGLAISSTLAMLGALSVACGAKVLGSGAGEGTSICGGSVVLLAAWCGRSAQRAPRNTARRTATMPRMSLSEASLAVLGRGSGEETPGICGISVLKRSAGGLERSDGDESSIGLSQ